jgi:poly-beta-1,6-N-acetyl-D-glucosamine N-deacetylase
VGDADRRDERAGGRRAVGDAYAVSLGSFVRQLDYLVAQGLSFVSVDRILRSSLGASPLPEKAVLLTFDDAYESFYSNVFPILKARGYPRVLAVVSSWPDCPEGRAERTPPLMSWSGIREVADSGLVEIASHSHDGHKAVAADPCGSTAPAMASREYDASARAYEAA